MKFSNQVIIKRWIPILQEYEKTINKIQPRSFKFVKNICSAYHISGKELRRYYRKWLEGNKSDEALLPKKRGRPPKEKAEIQELMQKKREAGFKQVTPLRQKKKKKE